MNSELDRKSARLAFRIAGSAYTVLLLASVAVPAAQTTDSSPTSKSALGQISGRVYRSDTGESVPKAEVELYPADPSTAKAAGPERIVRTGPDGTFVFSDLPAGTFGVSVWRNGFSEVLSHDEHGQFVTLRPGEKVNSVTLRLRPTGVIAGQVSDEDREAVQGLEVLALRVRFRPGGRKQISQAGRTATDDLGNFRMPNLQPGSYYVSAGGMIQHPMGATGLKQGPTGGMQYRNTFYPGTPAMDEAQVVTIGPEATATNDIRFTVPTERNYAITGKVISAEARPALKDAEVSCERVDAAGYTFGPIGDNVQLESDHSFNCSSLAPGDYRLKVKTTDAGVEHELGYASVRVVDSNVNADIEIGRAAEVRGSVETPQGLSLVGKRVTLETFGPGFYLLHGAPIVDPGRFVIPNIPPGEFTFTVLGAQREESAYVKKAICGGRGSASRELTLAVGTTVDCDVTLASDTGAIQGKVTDGEKRARGLVVALIPESKELRRIPRYSLTARTDVAGQYKITGAIPGEYLLFAVPSSTDDAYFAIDFPENHADIAERVKVDPSTTQSVNLKSSEVER